MDTNGKIIKTTIGTPQGSVVSPILSNIVLHELDKFMHRYKNNFEVRSRAVNPKYHSLNCVRNKTKNGELRAKNLTLIPPMNPKDTQDPYFKRLLYVRYADDFVILLICSLQEAFTIKRSLKDFLKMKFGPGLPAELNLDKTTIVSTRKGFNFLGASLRKVDQVKTSLGNKSNHVVRRRSNRRLVINAPLRKLVDKLIKNKFLRIAKKNHLNKVIATSRKDLINHSHFDILNFYN